MHCSAGSFAGIELSAASVDICGIHKHKISNGDVSSSGVYSPTEPRNWDGCSINLVRFHLHTEQIRERARFRAHFSSTSSRHLRLTAFLFGFYWQISILTELTRGSLKDYSTVRQRLSVRVIEAVKRDNFVPWKSAIYSAQYIHNIHNNVCKYINNVYVHATHTTYLFVFPC